MITPKDYADIANNAYEVDPLRREPPLKEGGKVPPGNPKFIVISEPASDPASGFQGMAVAPLVNGVADFSHVYVAFAGTNPGHRADINSDIQLIVGEQTTAAQAVQAQAYAEKVRAEVLAKHPGATFTTVGHSLGGNLAMYIAGRLHWTAVSFNGPDPWDAMSRKDQEWLKKQIALGKNPFVNYVNEWDAIGNFHGNGTAAAHYVSGASEGDLFSHHNIDSGFRFDTATGAILGDGVSSRTTLEIARNMVEGAPPFLREPIALALAGLIGGLSAPGVGNSVGRAVSATLVTVDTLAASTLASKIFGTTDVLSRIRSVNDSLIPEMQVGLDHAKQAMSAIPFITATDIENCVVVQRLRVEDNIDEHELQVVNRRIEEHQETIRKLSSGIGGALTNAARQDAQWVSAFAG